MTKKDYASIAQAISYANDRAETQSEFLGYLCKELGVIFYRDNPRYDHDRFMAAVRGE